MAETIVSKSYKIATDSSGNWDKVSMWKKADDVKNKVVTIDTLPQSGAGVRIERINDQTMHIYGKTTEAIEFGLNWHLEHILTNEKWHIFKSNIPSPNRVFVNCMKNGSYVTTPCIAQDGDGNSFLMGAIDCDQMYLGVHLEPGQGDFDFSIWGNDEYQQDIFNRSLQSTVGDIKGIANNLTTTESGYVLDARQGAILAAMFGGLTFGQSDGKWGAYTSDGNFISFGGNSRMNIITLSKDQFAHTNGMYSYIGNERLKGIIILFEHQYNTTSGVAAGVKEMRPNTEFDIIENRDLENQVTVKVSSTNYQGFRTWSLIMSGDIQPNSYMCALIGNNAGMTQSNHIWIAFGIQ